MHDACLPGIVAALPQPRCDGADHRHPAAKAFAALSGDDSPQAAQAFAKRYLAHADQVMVELTTLLPYAAETARALKTRGIRTAIVSTKFRYRILAILERRELRDAFDVVIGGEDVSEHKPHPEGLQLALSQLQVAPHEAWYVGDHLVDAEAAARAQLDFVAVLTGNTTREDFAAYRVQHFIESMQALPTLIET